MELETRKWTSSSHKEETGFLQKCQKEEICFKKIYTSRFFHEFSLVFLPRILSKNLHHPSTLASSKVGYFSASSLALLFWVKWDFIN